jgi:nucleoside-diphosphate-sugar epimerase
MVKLVTGGTGFIGAELVHMLVERGEEVVVLHHGTDEKRLADIKSKVKIVRADLGNWSEVLNTIKDNHITDIYHIASMMLYLSETNPWGSFQTNIVGTYNILEAARILGVPRVMFTSSGGVFGIDISDDTITDTTIQRPTGIYGINKLYCENLGRFYRNKFGLDFRSIRYPSVIGPGVRTPMHWSSPMIENAILGKPVECMLTENIASHLMYFKDTARACDMIMQAPQESIKMVNYNVGSNREKISAGELARAIKKQIPDANISYKPDPFAVKAWSAHAKVKYWDDSIARREWAWQPLYTTPDAWVSDFINEIKTRPERYGLT